MKRLLFFTFLLLCIAVPTSAQKSAFSTNLADWAFLGTMNMEASVAVSQHFTLNAGLADNPWKFHSKDPEMDVTNQMMSIRAGLRYWPWYVYSGWWLAAGGQYKDYSRTGIWRPALEEGIAIGGYLCGGYSLMIGKHFNVEAGTGIWAGRLLEYTLYCCPVCKDIRDEGPRRFLKLDNISVSISYVF